MANAEAKNCWEFWNCDKSYRKNCYAYNLDSGRECWLLVGGVALVDTRCPRGQNEFEECWECPWFKKLNPNFG
jgi:hypothetical protein